MFEGGFVGLHAGADFSQDIVKRSIELPAAVGKDELLGADEVGEGMKGQAEGVELIGDLDVRLRLAAQLDEAADVDAQQLNLLIQAGGLSDIQPGKVGGLEPARIEAVFCGVEVARLAATLAGGIGRKVRQGGTSEKGDGMYVYYSTLVLLMHGGIFGSLRSTMSAE